MALKAVINGGKLKGIIFANDDSPVGTISLDKNGSLPTPPLSAGSDKTIYVGAIRLPTDDPLVVEESQIRMSIMQDAESNPLLSVQSVSVNLAISMGNGSTLNFLLPDGKLDIVNGTLTAEALIENGTIILNCAKASSAGYNCAYLSTLNERSMQFMVKPE